jgi:beta-lactamase regulating signal transducer with metallopeptidase domain
MEFVYQTLLWNAIGATVLSILVVVVTKFVRHPPLVHFLWLLVLLKLIVLPLRSVEIHIPRSTSAAGVSAAAPVSHPQIVPAEIASEAVVEQGSPIGLDRATIGRHENVQPRDSLAVRPPPVSLDLPLLTEAAQVPDAPNTVDRRAGDFASGRSSPEKKSETAIPLTARITPVPWSWASSLRVAGWVWLVGSVLWFAVAALRVMRFERCRRQAAIAPALLQAEARRLARQLGLTRCPIICVVQGRLPPMLWAMTGRATILLPSHLLEQISPSQQAMVLAHEMAHFARRDHWFRWLDVIVLGVYWWFPVAWWARRQLHHAAEECCDAWVVWLFPKGARCYARLLLETIDFLSAARPHLPVGASSLGRFHFYSLQRRFRMILSKSMTRRLPWSMRVTAVLLGLAVLSVSARGVWGQAAKAPAVKPKTPEAAEDKADAPAPKAAESIIDVAKQPGAATEIAPAGAAENKVQAASGLPSTPGTPTTPASEPTVPAGVPPTPASVPTVSAGALPPPMSAPVVAPGAPPPPMVGVARPSAAPSPAAGLPPAEQSVTVSNAADPLVSGAVPPLGEALTPLQQPGANAFPAVAPVPNRVLPTTMQQSNVEQRLQRLEALTSQILQELRRSRRRNPETALDVLAAPSSDATQASQLHAVDDQIRGLVAEMNRMQVRLAKLKDARAKLASQLRPDDPRSIVPTREDEPRASDPTVPDPGVR